MALEAVTRDNQKMAYSMVERLVGGDIEAHFQSQTTLAAIWEECGSNQRIQQLVTNYLFGSYERAKENKSKLEAELRAVFGLESVGA